MAQQHTPAAKLQADFPRQAAKPFAVFFRGVPVGVLVAQRGEVIVPGIGIAALAVREVPCEESS